MQTEIFFFFGSYCLSHLSVWIWNRNAFFVFEIIELNAAAATVAMSMTRTFFIVCHKFSLYVYMYICCKAMFSHSHPVTKPTLARECVQKPILHWWQSLLLSHNQMWRKMFCFYWYWVTSSEIFTQTWNPLLRHILWCGMRIFCVTKSNEYTKTGIHTNIYLTDRIKAIVTLNILL